MKKLEVTDANALATVTSHIVEILTPFELEDRRKILNAVAMLLGTPSVPQVAPKNSRPADPLLTAFERLAQAHHAAAGSTAKIA